MPEPATFPVFQLFRSWLNALAPSNMRDMFVTLETSHALSGWLNAGAYWNITDRSVTLPVFHVASAWLKTVA